MGNLKWSVAQREFCSLLPPPTMLSVLGDCDDLKPSFHQLLSTAPLECRDSEDSSPHSSSHSIQLWRVCFGYCLCHIICDGIGIAQFLYGLGEMARGVVKLPVQPIWDRELLKPRNPPQAMFHHSKLVTDSFISSFQEHEEFVQYFYFFGFQDHKINQETPYGRV